VDEGTGRIFGSVTILTSPAEVEEEECGRTWKRRTLSRHLGNDTLTCLGQLTAQVGRATNPRTARDADSLN
jgi:hypothetical protein